MKIKTTMWAAVLLGVSWLSACDRSDSIATKLESITEPSEGRALPKSISAATISRYYLYLDSFPDKKVVYYIPRIGSVTNLGTREHPKPDFAVSRFKADFGVFTGKNLLTLGGSFSSSGDNLNLRQLESEVKAAGYTLRPAPVVDHRTYWLILNDKLSENQTFEVKCEHRPMAQDGSSSYYVECLTKKDDEWVPVLPPLLSASVTNAHSSEGHANLAFQAKTSESFAADLEQAIKSGAAWGDKLRVLVDWELDATQNTHKADIKVNFNKTYEFLSNFERFHDGSCTDREIANMWEKVTTCAITKTVDGKEEDCGVSITFYDPLTGKPMAQASPVEDIVKLASAVQSKFNDKFFDIMFEKEQRTIAVADASNIDRNVRYVFKQNRENRRQDINWKQTVYYNPGKVKLRARTLFSADCMTVRPKPGQDIIGSAISWNVGDPACRSALGI